MSARAIACIKYPRTTTSQQRLKPVNDEDAGVAMNGWVHTTAVSDSAPAVLCLQELGMLLKVTELLAGCLQHLLQLRQGHTAVLQDETHHTQQTHQKLHSVNGCHAARNSPCNS